MTQQPTGGFLLIFAYFGPTLRDTGNDCYPKSAVGCPLFAAGRGLSTARFSKVAFVEKKQTGFTRHETCR